MDVLYSQWLLEKQDLLVHLLSVPQDRPDLQIPLIIRMLSHCAVYYNLKSQLAERDIFQLGTLSPQHPAMDALYSQWLLEKQDLLIHLLSVPQDRPDLQIPLIIRMLSHCAEYYNLKSLLAERDIFQVFSAYWLTPIERSFLWLGDVKPSTIFQFVPSSLINDQRRMMEQLKSQVVQRQTELEETMRQVDETMTVLMALVAVHGPIRNGEARGDVEHRVVGMMCAVSYEADRLRKHVVTRIIQILSTGQTVHFFVSAANFHLWLRRYGLQLHRMAHETMINFG